MRDNDDNMYLREYIRNGAISTSQTPEAHMLSQWICRYSLH